LCPTSGMPNVGHRYILPNWHDCVGMHCKALLVMCNDNIDESSSEVMSTFTRSAMGSDASHVCIFCDKEGKDLRQVMTWQVANVSVNVPPYTGLSFAW